MKRTVTAYLIRHGLTNGNLEKRYIGCRSDEPLCDEGRQLLIESAPVFTVLASSCTRLFTSPMKRSIETAGILFPTLCPEIVSGLSETDFGDFEGLNYSELNGRSDYQAWLDSCGTIPFPNGESRESFIERSFFAFRGIIDSCSGNCVIVCHGGSIMAIMSSLTGKDYFDFQVGSGEGFRITLSVSGEEYNVLSYDRICGRNTA